MISLNSPCRYCQKRFFNCHSICSAYSEYKRQIEQLKNIDKEEQYLNTRERSREYAEVCVSKQMSKIYNARIYE